MPTHEFETHGKQHHIGRSFRTATRWSQFVMMAMAQLSGQNSLRDIVENISAQAHRFYHLGIGKLTWSNLSRIKDAVTGKHYIFLTNNFKLSARTAADICKARWQIELFFKWVKQNLKIKSFVGTSKNAIMTHIWIALCIYLLLSFIKFQSKLSKSMQQILRLLQLNLFEKRELMALLRGDPAPDRRPDIYQMALL